MGKSESGQAPALLNAAEDLFAERGFHGTGVTDITERAGTSVGTLYYHFGSKDGIYRALWTRYMRSQAERARDAITLLRDAGVTDGRRLFLAGTRAYLTSAWAHRGIVKMAADGDTPSGFAQDARAAAREWTRQNTKLLKLDDPLADRALGAIVTGSIGGIAREVAECETGEQADALIARAIEIYRTLLGLPADPQDQPSGTPPASALID